MPKNTPPNNAIHAVRILEFIARRADTLRGVGYLKVARDHDRAFERALADAKAIPGFDEAWAEFIAA